MADTKISALPASTTPLAGTEVLPIVQSSVTKQVSVANLTAGRAVAAATVQIGSGTGGGSVPSTSKLLFAANNSIVTFLSANDSASVDGEIGSWNTVYNHQNAKIVFDKPTVNTGQLLFYTQNGSGIAERARFNTTGALVFAGGTSTADGIGITFPSTQSASSNANTLDDYEEGTWTPSVGGTATYTTQEGFYTRIGRQVTIWADLTILLIGTGSTSQISGNPFTPAVGISYMPGSVYWENLAISETSLITVTQGGSGSIWFCGRATAATSIDNVVAILGNGARVRFCITYNA